MKRKFLKFFVLAGVVAAISLTSCKDDDSSSNSQITEPEKQEQPAQQATFKVSVTKLSFSLQGGSQVITVSGNSNSALAFANQSWVTIKSSADNQFEIVVAKLEGSSDRTAVVTIAADGTSLEIPVTQYAEDKITLSQESAQMESKGGNVEFSVTCNVDYEVVTSCSWLSQVSEDNGKYTFAAKQNNSARVRKGSVTIKTANKTVTFAVAQEPGTKVEVSASSSAMDIAKYMYPGWNLGNTMEATGGETAWQSAKTTQEIIDYVADCGFTAIRIPCSWYQHSSKNAEGKYIIQSSWMSRVKEIVDYAINAGLFVELNEHWDKGFIEVLGFSKSDSKYEAVDQDWIDNKTAIFKDLWTQIATEFKDYDNHLLFAGLNEPLQEYDLFKNPSKGGDHQQELTPLLEKYNQAFVDAVRATGGNNSTRILVVQGTGADLLTAYNYLNMPEDPAGKGKLMMEAHYYPWPFSFNDQQSASTSFTGENDFINLCKKLKQKFCDNGVPVFIGEYGANWTMSAGANKQVKHDEAIKLFYKVVSKWGPSYGCLPFAWDINQKPTNNVTMTIIDRNSLRIWATPAYEGIMEGTDEAVWPY